MKFTDLWARGRNKIENTCFKRHFDHVKDNDGEEVILGDTSAQQSFSWEDLYRSNTDVNFYLNDGWLHLLLRQNSDRRQGGTLRVGGSRFFP